MVDNEHKRQGILIYKLAHNFWWWNYRMWILPDSRKETDSYAEKEHQLQHLELVNDCEQKSVSDHLLTN